MGETMDVIIVIISVLTLFVMGGLTFTIYRLTSLIASSDTVSSINEGWSYYNNAMLQGDNVTCMNEFLESNERFDGKEKKVHFLIYLILNCLSNQFYSAKAKTLKLEFHEDSAPDHLRWLFPKREYIIALAEARGYDDDYMTYIKSNFNKLENE